MNDIEILYLITVAIVVFNCYRLAVIEEELEDIEKMLMRRGKNE